MLRLIVIFGILLTGPAALAQTEEPLGARIAKAAEARTEQNVRYDGSYLVIPYPMGDVPNDTGVCTDVVIRSLRKIGIDLQKEIHEDMRAAFKDYPARWGLSRPDRNIDHRRVPNIQTWAKRQGWALPVTEDKGDYLPGDLVTWNVAGSAGELPHIGIVSNQTNDQGRPLIVHNIGGGPVLDDMIFHFPVTGHYRIKKES